MYDPVVIAADWLKNSRDQFNDKMKNKKMAHCRNSSYIQ
jgi:hypothetical protein